MDLSTILNPCDPTSPNSPRRRRISISSLLNSLPDTWSTTNESPSAGTDSDYLKANTQTNFGSSPPAQAEIVSLLCPNDIGTEAEPADMDWAPDSTVPDSISPEVSGHTSFDPSPAQVEATSLGSLAESNSGAEPVHFTRILSRPSRRARYAVPSAAQNRFVAILHLRGRCTFAKIAHQYGVKFGMSVDYQVMFRRLAKYRIEAEKSLLRPAKSKTRAEKSEDAFYIALTENLPVPEEWREEVDNVLQQHAAVDGSKQSTTFHNLDELHAMAVLKTYRPQLTVSEIAVKLSIESGKPLKAVTLNSRWAKYKKHPDEFYRALLGEIPLSAGYEAKIDQILRKHGSLGADDKNLKSSRALALPTAAQEPSKAEAMRFLTSLRFNSRLTWDSIADHFAEHFNRPPPSETGIDGLHLSGRWGNYRRDDGGLYQSLQRANHVPPEFKAEYDGIVEKYCTNSTKPPKGCELNRISRRLSTKQLRFCSFLRHCFPRMPWTEVIVCFEQEFGSESAGSLKTNWFRRREEDEGVYRLLKNYNQVLPQFEEELDHVLTKYAKPSSNVIRPQIASSD